MRILNDDHHLEVRRVRYDNPSLRLKLIISLALSIFPQLNRGTEKTFHYFSFSWYHALRLICPNNYNNIPKGRRLQTMWWLINDFILQYYRRALANDIVVVWWKMFAFDQNNDDVKNILKSYIDWSEFWVGFGSILVLSNNTKDFSESVFSFVLHE